jgi:hypothetical protein
MWPPGRIMRWEDSIKIVLRKISCENGRCQEVAQVNVQWQALISAMFFLSVILPESE